MVLAKSHERELGRAQEGKAMKRHLIVGLVVCFVSFGMVSCAGQGRPDDFGKQWVRNHPFTIMALTLRPAAVADEKYSAANLNTFLVWKRKEGLFESAVRQNLPWHVHLLDHDKKSGNMISDRLKNQFSELLKTYPCGQGALIWDEPRDVREMREVGSMVAWMKENHPDILVYSNVYSHPTKYYKDFVALVKPDVFMMDIYPFRNGLPGKNDTYADMQEDYFRTMGDIRRESLDAGIPLWVFIQSFGESNWRVPSKSEMTMHVYSSLAYGVTGIAYFTFDHYGGGLINCLGDNTDPGTVTSLYHEAKRINPQIANLGKTLRFLTSTDVRYIPGKEVVKGCEVYNSTPDGIDTFREWASKEVKAVRIDSPGKGKNGMIGFFKDDKGKKYFMLVNLWCEPGAAVDACTLKMTLKLKPSIKKVARLSRDTGKPEVLAVKDGVLEITLPGGTGDLFKIDDAVFPGI